MFLIGMNRSRLAVAAVVFVVAFLYRFNALGGALGGFDSDHFIFYLGGKAVAHGERPLRDFADAGLMGAWPALTYELSGLAQRMGGETLLSEAVLVVGALALALSVLFVTAADVSGPVSAVVVTIATLFMSTKLYGYSKVLVFAVAAALFLRYVRQPSRSRAMQLAIWSAVAFLFRHDFLVYLAPSVVVLIALSSSQWREAADRLIVYSATLALLLAAPVYSIQHYPGLGPYLETNRALVADESNRTTFRWPHFSSRGHEPFFSKEDNAVAWLYYISLLIPVLALVTLIGSPQMRGLDSRQTRALIVSLAVLALILERFFLRNNLGARFGDLGAPVAILAAWLPARYRDASSFVRWSVRSVVAVVVIATVLALSTTGSVAHELDTTGFSDSIRKLVGRVGVVGTELGAIPLPSDAALGPEPNAAEYVRVCTRPDDRVLVLANAPEILAFAGRLFAGGKPAFRTGYYRLERDQRITLDRWRQQSVPIVLTDEERTYAPNFAAQFYLIDEYLKAHYDLVGELPALAGDPVRVFALRSRSPTSRYRSAGLPCFR
jgi:hypothetical protein